MSTQRRENGSTPATKTYRRGPRNRWQRSSCTEFANGLGQIWVLLLAWFSRALARVGTAPPQEAAWLPLAWTATNSLQSDHTIKLVRQDFRRTSRSSPPLRAARSATTGTPATRRSSLPLIPLPSVFEHLHPFRPHSGSPIDVTRNHVCRAAFS
jgi:hypothetical protein